MGQIAPVADGWKHSSPGRYVHDSGGRLINGYAEQADANGKMQYPLYAIEGLATGVTLTSGGGFRGGIDLTDTVGYAVSGTNVDKVTVDSDGSLSMTNVGFFPGTQRVFMARNRKAGTPQIAIVGEGSRSILEDDAVTPIADPDLPSGTISVAQVGGYFIYALEDGKFYISAIDDGTDIAALDFATAEARADGLYAAQSVRQEVALFGPKSIEFWALTGAAFPFERIPGTTLFDLGLLSKYSIQSLNDVPFFIASDGTVRMLDGYQPVRVSNGDVERAIDGISDKHTITATAYSWRDHQFYIISSAAFTWAYDTRTGLWHERKSVNDNRWIGEGYLKIGNTKLVGHYNSNVLYKLDADTYTEAGGNLIWELHTPPIHAWPHPLGFDRLFVDLIPGVGLNSSDSHLSNPQLMMSFSDDGGKTFSNERTKSVGQLGEHTKRTRFERLGQSLEDGRKFKLSMSAAVIRGLTGASVEVELIEP